MTAQLGVSLQPDSLLYSFTPGSVGRGGTGGSPVATGTSIVSQQLLNSPRRLRTQSVPGEPAHCEEEAPEKIHSDLSVCSSPRAPACTAGSGPIPSTPLNGTFSGNNPSPNTNSSSSSSSNSSGGITSSTAAGPSFSAELNPGAPGMPARLAPAPAGSMSRCGSADRHQLSHHHNGPSSSLGIVSFLTGGPAAMPAIAGSGERTLPPMRHSVSGVSSIGLPKLDLPALAFGSHGGGGSSGASGGPLDRPVLGSPSRGRRSLSGGLSEAAASAASAAFLDLPPPTAAFDGSAPPSPTRSSAPAVLAPLRVSGALAAAVATAAGGDSAGGGWCSGGGGGSGGGGLLTCPSSRRYTASAEGRPDGSCLVPSMGPLLPCASEGALATPLTPNKPTGSSCAPPRRSHSLTARGPNTCNGGSRRLGDDCSGGGGGAGDDDADCSPADPVADRPATAAAAVAAVATLSSAAKALYDINADLQRTAGALSELHAPAFRPRSAAALAAAAGDGMASPTHAAAAEPPLPPLPLTRAQLIAVREVAPELQWELRVAVRRVFQVVRQELTAVPAGRQLASSAHECWATLDAYLEGTSDLTCALVEGALKARDAATQPQPLQPPQRQTVSVGRSDGEAASGGSVMHADATQREVERLRAVNEGLMKQLEEFKARLAKAEAALETASCTRGGGGDGGTAAAAPRPPPPPAAPPSERVNGTSPRRGKHALVQSNRDDGAAASDARTTNGADGAVASSSSSASVTSAVATVATPPATARGGEASPQRRFDRTAILARAPSYKEMVIEAEDSEEDALQDGSDFDDSIEARRQMLTYHSASFAEWVRGARRR